MEELGKVIEERKQKKLSEAEKAKEREEQLKKEHETALSKLSNQISGQAICIIIFSAITYTSNFFQ